MDDDRARQHFLDALLARVGDGSGRLVAELRPMAPFPGTCATLRAEGVQGAAILIPVSVAHGAKVFSTFPGPGTPHIDLYVTQAADDDWLRGISGHLCTCDIEQLVTAIRNWRDAPLPRPPLQAAPLTADELGLLRVIAGIRQALARIAVDMGQAAEPRGRYERWEAFGVVDGLGAEQTTLTAGARAHLAADLEHLDPARLLGNVPRDGRGRLTLGVTVLLASYETIEPQRPIYGMWLAAHSPERLRDPQVIALRLRTAISENQSRRWEAARAALGYAGERCRRGPALGGVRSAGGDAWAGAAR